MCSDAKTRKKKQEYGAIEERNASKLRTPPTPTLPTPPTASVAAKGLGNDKEEATEIKP